MQWAVSGWSHFWQTYHNSAHSHPITLQYVACSSIATQPVVAQDGFIYHKDCANDFLQTEFGKTSFISQVTGKVVGGTLIPLVEPAIQLFQQCKTKETKDEDEGVVDTIMKAKLGDTQCMALLGEYGQVLYLCTKRLKNISLYSSYP